MIDNDGHRFQHPAPRNGWPEFDADGRIIRPGDADDREASERPESSAGSHPATATGPYTTSPGDFVERTDLIQVAIVDDFPPPFDPGPGEL